MDLNSFKSKINIKYFMALYLSILLVYSSVALQKPERIWKGLLIVLLYAVFDLTWTYLRDKNWYLPISSLISAFILALVALPDPPLALAFFLPLLAVASKQILSFGKNRHIFNPAAFSLAAVSLVTPAVSWWGVAWGTPPLAITLLVGIAILWRQNRWHVAIPFLVSYTLLLITLFIWNKIPIAQVINFLEPQIVDGTILFFATVMLIEPLTSNFPTTSNRIVYGTLVGFAAVFTTFIASRWNLENQDPLIYGLIAGNLVASLVFLPSKKTVEHHLA